MKHQANPFLLALIIVSSSLVLLAVNLYQSANVVQAPLEKKTAQNLFIDFAKKASIGSSSKTDGILPEPPREAIKQLERLLKDNLKSDYLIDYSLIKESGEKEVFPVTVWLSGSPFRYKLEFKNLKINYGYKLIFDGNNYLVCDKTGDGGCDKLPSLNELQTPYDLTVLLNLLDELQLRKFIPGTKEAASAQTKEENKTIAGLSAACTTKTDTYGTVEFCFDSNNVPLVIKVATNLNDYSLEAQKVQSIKLDSSNFPP